MDRQFRWLLAGAAATTIIGAVGYQLLPSRPAASRLRTSVVGKWEGDCKEGTPTKSPRIHIDRGSELSLLLSGRFEAVLIHFTPAGDPVPGGDFRGTIKLTSSKIAEAAKSPQLFKRDMDEGDYQFEFRGSGSWLLEVRR
jgi:hypothetical protein